LAGSGLPILLEALLGKKARRQEGKERHVLDGRFDDSRSTNELTIQPLQIEAWKKEWDTEYRIRSAECRVQSTPYRHSEPPTIQDSEG
jgi:hypothetical protein